MSLWALMIRCLRVISRHRFIFFTLLAVLFSATLGLFVIEKSKQHPKISFFALKFGVALGFRPLIDATANYDQVRLDLAKDVMRLALANLSQSGVDENTQLEVAKTQSAILNILSQVMPAAIKSPEAEGFLSGLSEPSTNLGLAALPAILKVDSKVWDQWLDEIKRGNFSLGNCRIENARAACEVRIAGPNSKESVVVFLWVRNGLLWRLEKILGVENLVDAMR